MRKNQFLLLAAALPGAATAEEIINYRYDARGRLVNVERSGSVNNGIVTSYKLDKADNRIGVTTAGASRIGVPPGSATPAASISPTLVLPLNGYLVVPISE